jgi:hypothetical protein
LYEAIFSWPATGGSGGVGLLILPEGDGGGVVDCKELEEEAQFNIPVPSRRGPA